MSGYNRDAKTFTLTAVKMEHYHRHHTHATFSRKNCPICNSQYGQEYMEMVAAFLTANGFEVVDVGDAHITISAPSKPRTVTNINGEYILQNVLFGTYTLVYSKEGYGTYKF